jgi:hypothetical protein
MMAAAPVDLDDFDATNTDRDKILAGAWVPCRICKEIFARVRLTARFCNNCNRAFCEGEHGSFTGGGPAMCVRCYSKAGGELA